MNNSISNALLDFKTSSTNASKQTNTYSKDLKNANDNFSNILNKTYKTNDKEVSNNRENFKSAKSSKLSESSTKSNTEESNELEGKKDKVVNEKELMILLQQLLKGEISLEDFNTKIAQSGEQIKDLSMELTKISMKAIEGNIKLNSDQLNALESKLSSDLTQALKDMMLENSEEGKSFDALMSKINDAIKNALEEVNSSDTKEDSIVSLQDKIISEIESKLKGDKTNNKLSDFNNLSDNDASENIKNSTMNKLQNTNNENKGSSKGDSSEDRFLKGLASGNKDDVTNKVDKLVTFMNSFNKTTNTNNISEAQQVMTVNKDTFINDIIRSVKFMQQNDMKEMTVKIMPRELGEVVIKITMENGLMKANITANNKEAYNLLNSSIQDLNKIGNGEIKIQNFTIDIYNGDTTFFSRENSKEQNRHSSSGNKGKPDSLGIESEIEDIPNSRIVEENNVNAFV